MIKVIKIGSKTCGSCGKMSHYDEKVTEELGYEWLSLEKGTNAYKYATDTLNEVRKFFGRSIGFPTYAIYEDGKLVHAFMGATDKGTFRKRLQRETLNSEAVKTLESPLRVNPVNDSRAAHCNGGDTFDVVQPDASCTNWIKFTSTNTGEEFEYESKKTGTYEMNFKEANTVFQVSFRSTCGDFSQDCDTKVQNGGKLLRLEDAKDADYTDLIITCTEGLFAGRYSQHQKDLTYTSGATAACPGGQVCCEGQCADTCAGQEPAPTPPKDCGGPCPDGSKCIPEENKCEWIPVERNIIPACLQFQCCQNKCEEGRPDGNTNIGDGDGDGLGDCDKRPIPEPVPGSNSKNQVYLYDRLNHTYIFCCPIKADVTWLLPFDTMPPVFQRYVTTTASVRVAAQMVNNPQLFQLLKDRENTLRMECMNYEMEQADLNFLNQPDHSTYMSYQTMQTLNR